MKSLRIQSFPDYQNIYSNSIESPEGFWGEIAEQFIWKQKWNKVLDANFEEPNINWFVGGKLNITESILEKNCEERPNQQAIIWEPNGTEDKVRTFTYKELSDEVCKAANGLKELGVKKGDRVIIYMPMVPELAFAVLACARIGAIHSVVFAGFSAQALADRINDAQAKLIITSDGLKRGSKELNIKEIVDEAVSKSTCIENVLMLKYSNTPINWNEKTDVIWQDLIHNQSTTCPAEIMDSEDMLFILYTSGSTGKPKGVVHTCGGYMVYTAYSFQNVFQYKEGDIYWCTADIGWITGHSYIVYGPLLSGATSIMFEGIPTYPDAGRFWQVCEKHQVNQFYTAPTAIRALMGCGEEIVKQYDLSSLKVLGSVGEPINDEAWQWYYDVVGNRKCPIVDTWWQTETGGIMLSGLGKLSPMRPTHAGYPLPGIQPVLLNSEGEEIEENDVEGYLCIKQPWPSMIRTTYGDHERCKNVYFSNYKGYYFTGDGAKRAENGMYRIIGRVDDVINVSGHRFGTAEIEDAINSCESVVESAVVGYPHPIKGQGIYAYVICDSSKTDEIEILTIINASVEKMIGKIARPEKVQLVTGLPKTRSGKIMRRILRKIAEGELDSLGDTSTLLDPSVVERIIENRK